MENHKMIKGFNDPECLVYGSLQENTTACIFCESNFKSRYEGCVNLTKRKGKNTMEFNQNKLLKVLLKLHIKMNKLLHEAMFTYRYSLDEKRSSKFFASTDSIAKEKLQDAELRKERINFAIELFYKHKNGMINAEKQARKYCILARSFDYIFNELLDDKTSQKFYNIVDFKEYL